ncbi:uncharacterized protein Z518_05426 [Rhinocladiella mackenziei CBS 650.93]|uniref:Rhinocladiella mackenziei CBS 650.93 unplaced genomic scaffold supercont1.4, whole genome shotgun sequence n=1 Tax=Rhinocladiella mackenziei CBS 650.93 TaxID=1442369 RepID=A0A0D2IN61_9EURO|nr:uncharacterized protein Z518_05426 [Rhinocladiella mackenziei CBS 650.93]KIX04556.1 hypothetical protein Z518_05426 [Rhinocladiella mackenziei CBS 650.93]
MTFTEILEAATKPGPNRKVPGAVVIAADASGNIIHFEAQGVTSVAPELAKPMAKDTTFWIASCTKLLTTVAVLQCVEKGQLTLDDDVSSILPEWKEPEILTGFDEKTGQPQMVKAKNKITLRHLLTHSSGMGYDFISPKLKQWRELRGEKMGPVDGDIAKQYTLPLLFEPGEGWSYSCAIDWAGQMVERVNGGIRLGEYMKKHIWEPLDMPSTAFPKTPTGDFVVATPYPAQNPKDDLGGGGLYSCASDYVKVLISLLKNDGALLRPETVQMMFTPQLADSQHLKATVTMPDVGPLFRSGVESESWNFGLGGCLNMKDVDGICKKGTMTWGGLPNLFWWIDPAAGTCGLYMSQLLPPGDPASIDLALELRKDIFARRGR